MAPKTTSPALARSRHNPRAFTLVELLVTISIIALLAGILLPVILRANATARRTRAAADLQGIATALEAFKTQFGNYPEVTAGDGAKSLYTLLYTPYQPRAGGKSYGPFLNTDKYKAAKKNGVEIGIADLWSDRDPPDDPKPILYFLARTAKPNITLPGGYVSNTADSLYNISQNVPVVFPPPPLPPFARAGETSTLNAQKRVAMMLGDIDRVNLAAPTNFDGGIESNEKAATSDPFLLWSAGPNRLFGPTRLPPDTGSIEDLADCDDVTNFR